VDLLIGLGLIAIAGLALWVALPRDGRVRGFLRSDQVQAYFTVAILGALALGLVYLFTGFRALFASWLALKPGRDRVWRCFVLGPSCLVMAGALRWQAPLRS
jgi:hypothetical protein